MKKLEYGMHTMKITKFQTSFVKNLKMIISKINI